ncbi:hypothetical protein DRP04_14610 [Archaeoglobales archaeon]|nr:MAG: hypothetical protein DRP04_14610 [Archaeoglobales archaeon]
MKIQEIEKAARESRKEIIAAYLYGSFRVSGTTYQAVKYSLLEIVEACIDIASHIISAKGFERAESYAECFFKILGAEGRNKRELAGSYLTWLDSMQRFSKSSK